MKILTILALIYYISKAIVYIVAYFATVPKLRNYIEYNDKLIFFKIMGLLFLLNYINK